MKYCWEILVLQCTNRLFFQFEKANLALLAFGEAVSGLI